jgi:hypothetical protein
MPECEHLRSASDYVTPQLFGLRPARLRAQRVWADNARHGNRCSGEMPLDVTAHIIDDYLIVEIEPKVAALRSSTKLLQDRDCVERL